VLEEAFDNSPRSVAIPELRGTSPLAIASQYFPGFADYFGLACADERVRALRNRDRPLGIIANRQARHSQNRGFLLHAARIGQNQLRIGHQTQ
jgi:hypothetical protein